MDNTYYLLTIVLSLECGEMAGNTCLFYPTLLLFTILAVVVRTDELCVMGGDMCRQGGLY